MRTHPSSESGFTLAELLIATAISLVVIGTAMTTFKDAVAMTGSATNQADASLNLRGGLNLLIRDLMATGRGIPTGGIPIPTGTNSQNLNRPSPPGLAYYFDTYSNTVINAVTTGAGLGPTINNQATDMITVLSLDPLLDYVLVPSGAPDGSVAPLTLKPAGTSGNVSIMAADGASFALSTTDKTWLSGDPTNNIAPIMKGDILMFVNGAGSYAIQTVTRTDSTHAYFDSNSDDKFSFNQRNAAAGTIMPLLNGSQITVERVWMYTYYVDPNNGIPRLMRQYNFNTPQALAGVVEDLQLSYDLVDGTVNPTSIDDLPYTVSGVTYSANQIRKVTIHVGVRSETMALKPRDYLRTHLSTVVSLRQLAYVDRYK
jgi:type II secretory pathway pseudopilin PulG